MASGHLLVLGVETWTAGLPGARDAPPLAYRMTIEYRYKETSVIPRERTAMKIQRTLRCRLASLREAATVSKLQQRCHSQTIEEDSDVDISFFLKRMLTFQGCNFFPWILRAKYLGSKIDYLGQALKKKDF